ncbi:DUF547 domain-containing protein [Maricaulis sp. CAU 1757]
MRKLAFIGMTALAAAGIGLSATPSASAQTLASFTEYDADSRLHVDYTLWSDLMRDFVLNVPNMDREPERRRSISTGTRISTANETRYRYEANRVAYHLMSEEYEQAVSDYRAELEALPDQVDLSRLNSNEQLAYWLNLHNVAMLEQVMLNYPVTRINRMDAHGTNEPVFDAKILTVAGVPLSLNDIRLRIVYQQWDDPRVIYGFFNGSVGGPELSRTAFDGPRIWAQLDRNAREFVNALRGVEVSQRELRVSHIYAEAEKFFPEFDEDLRRHLRAFANEETAVQLRGGRPVRADIEAWEVADLINGSRRCTGTGGAALVYSSSEGPSSCGALPTNARYLLSAVQERRIELIQQGRYGEVFTVDIPTDPNGNPIRLPPAGSAATASEAGDSEE